MDLAETLFLIQFLALIAIGGMKLFNIFREGERWPISMAWLSFAGAVLLYGIGLVIYLNNVTKLLLTGLFAVERIMLLLCVLFMAVEQILYLKIASRSAFKSIDQKRA